MKDILEEICLYASARVEEAKKSVPLAEIRSRALAPGGKGGRFVSALRAGRAVIAEVKRSSPSKGLIAADFRPVDTALCYERAGADCVSVLTEPKWFGGSDEIFAAVREAVKLPLIRKDFTVDEYQLYEAKLMGADAVLLIVAALGERTADFLAAAKGLGLDALVETHDEREIEIAAAAGADIIGVNNRNLRDFSVDLHRSVLLRAAVPNGALFVAESGVSSPMDADGLFASGADAVLVGEALMRAADPAEFIRRVKHG